MAKYCSLTRSISVLLLFIAENILQVTRLQSFVEAWQKDAHLLQLWGMPGVGWWRKGCMDFHVWVIVFLSKAKT